MILSVGMLKQRKGFHVSLKAVAQVKEKYPNLRYYIVGRQEDKNYFEKLKQIVKDYNLENSVVFLENISDRELKKLYNQADLFLLTPVYIKGNFEGFGLVYLEAGAFGKPVVGSLGSGAEEAVVHNETGLLVPQNDPKATAEATIKILGNPELAKKLGQGNKNFTKDHDWERVAKKYQEIYKKFAS
ncbi:glycosyltransferase family 4 protein, partial [Patescibacteria group bacterium]|nr:glycosyltransferase family 4 protein [Patescibacteria group bacterium]